MGKKKGMTAAEKREAMWGWAFILPTMIGLIVLNFYPVIQTVYQSFCKTGDFGKGNIFIGFGNYQKLLADGEVWQSLWNTIKYAIIEVPFSVVIALLLAVLLNRKMKGVSVYRTIFFLPMVCAPAAVAMVWKWLYNQQFGLLNNIFHTNIAWISNPNIAWISIGVIGVWSIIGLIVLNFYPAFNTLWQSFCKTGDFGKGNVFIGFENYVKVFASGEVWHSLWNTIKYAIIEVPFGVIIALVLAVFLNKKLKGTSLFRTIFFLPMVCAPAAVAMVWKWLYNQQFGLLNNIFHTDIAWISDPNIAWISIGVIGVWSIIGYNMVLFISGLQEIPGDYYEAAEIDGATGIRQFFHITVPLLSPTTFFIVQTRIIGALTIFDLMFMVMDKTNLALENTQSIVYLFYDYAFTQGNKGYGATIVIFLVIFIMIVTFILQRAEKKLVYHP